jgi:hypothetical protein
MARHHMTSDGLIPFTLEEEAEWNAREQEFAENALVREWTVVRAERNKLLADCDWTQLPDAAADAAAWAVYRQALRDITDQSDPFNIQWPTTPAA